MDKASSTATTTVYYRLIAIWVLCEAMLGGIIHGLRIPVSGLIIGSAAVICISLIAWYQPSPGAILKATLIVAIFKMILSPQAPPPAYIALFFQGATGELLFRNKRFFKLSCLLLAVLAMLESGLQRIAVLTLVYGNDFWKAVNDTLNGLTRQKVPANYSLIIGIFYVMIHLVTGILVGSWAAMLPSRISKWGREKEGGEAGIFPRNQPFLPGTQKKKKTRWALWGVWIILILLYVQSYCHLGKPLLPSSLSLKILLRSFIIVLSWVFLIAPLLRQLLHAWLQKKKSRSQQDVQAVLQLMPATQALLIKSWKESAFEKGWKRIKAFCRIVLVNTLVPSPDKEINPVYILTGPVGSGKTTALLNWLEKRTDLFGILTPVMEGKRFFLNIHTREQWPMEVAAGEINSLNIGRFQFSRTAFNKAIEVLRTFSDQDGWLIIDEIGPLELSGEGFSRVLKEALARGRNKILLVVREGLEQRVMKYFKVTATLISREELSLIKDF